jgi:hypothetical protein
MAIVAGIIARDDKATILLAGYTLATHPAILPLLNDLGALASGDQEAIAVWVECGVTDLLVLGPSERTVKVTTSDVRQVAARLGVPLPDVDATRVAAQVAAHLQEAVEDEIAHALEQ